jgi:putative addiction module component (TIGR02574 family)
MTLAAVKKLAIKLPLRQRLKLAEAMLETLPPLREPVTLEELERRADEVLSGKVKAISSEEFDRDLAEMERRADEVLSGKVKALDADEVIEGLEQMIRSKARKRHRKRG